MNLKDKVVFIKWVSRLGKAWSNRNPKSVLPLFADKFSYYETPFTKPLTTKKDLFQLWQHDVSEAQKDIKFSFKLVNVSGNTEIAHWQATFTRIKQNKKASLDGIFLVKLNKKGLCTLFKQWWVTKE